MPNCMQISAKRWNGFLLFRSGVHDFLQSRTEEFQTEFNIICFWTLTKMWSKSRRYRENYGPLRGEDVLAFFLLSETNGH